MLPTGELMKQHFTSPKSQQSHFEALYHTFLQRYRKEEFEKDKERLLLLQGAAAEALPQSMCALIASAESFFSSDYPSKAQCEAVLSVRLGGISTRTIRNWRKDGRIYSESSSNAFNRFFDHYIPVDAPLDRRRLAWFWVAYSLMLNESEIDDFLAHCMEGQRSYVLDLFELAIRACISFNSLVGQEVWDFFDAVSFGRELEEASRGQQSVGIKPLNTFNLNAFSQNILKILRGSPLGDITGVADNLSLLYEDTQKYLEELAGQFVDESRVVLKTISITRKLEDVYSARFQPAKEPRSTDAPLTKPPLGAFALKTFVNHESLCEASVSESLQEEIKEYKAVVEKWVSENSCYFQAAHLSRLLTMLRLLIECVFEVSRSAPHKDFFEQWYYWCSLARGQAQGQGTSVNGSSEESFAHGKERSFPADPAHMADILLREDGVRFAGYSRERCLLYFSRLFEATHPISRRDYIEYYLFIRLHRARPEELNALLRGQRFSELNKQRDYLLLLFFSKATTHEYIYKSPEVFATKLAHFSEVICPAIEKSTQEAKASVWPIHEKLFLWNYPTY